MKNSFFVFSLIPLILLIGLVPITPFSYSEKLECPIGEVETVRITNPNSICIDSETAQRWEQLGIAKIVGEILHESIKEVPELEKLEEKTIESEKSLQIIQTRIGTLEIQSDYPTPETSQILKDELFFQRAIQVYQLAYPAIGGAGIFYDQEKIGATSGDILYWSDFMTSDVEILTANASVLYLLSLQDLSNGPIIVEIPAGRILGHIDNIYQQPLTDIGIPGPNQGNGGTFLILPPNYEGEVPEENSVIHSDTMQFFVIARSFVDEGDKSAAEERLLQVNIYNLSEAANPPKAKFFDLNGESLTMAHPTTEGFWEFLHQVYSKETIVRDEDKNLIGLMHTIGIIPGEPFAPDDHSKKLLHEAAIVGDLMTRNIGYNSPIKEHFIFYPEKQWELGFMTKNAKFEDDYGATQIEPRLSYTYQAITVSDAMVLELREKGSKYLLNYRDGNGDFLTGSNSYKLNIPANVPAVNFWSVIAYDAETRSMVVNDHRPRPAFGSQYEEHYTQNEDGSYDVYFGQKAPEGFENHLIKTNEGEGFFVIFRVYSPTEAFYDKSWQLPDIEKIE